MCFFGQKIQPTLISGDKKSEALNTDKTLPTLEHVIKDQHNLPNSTPSYICLSVGQRPMLCQGFEYNNEHASTDKCLDYLQ